MTTLKVGKVNLNLINGVYDGLDQIDALLGSDERKLLAYVRDCSPIEYQSIIEKENSYFFLESLSAIRENIVRWLPISSQDRILEIGAGVGAVTSGILKMSENVTTFENSATNARILAERFSNCNKLTVYCTEINVLLTDVLPKEEQFDWIIIRDLNYLKQVKGLLASMGHIVFLGDNRYGMKYLSGCRMPEAEDYFESLTDQNSLAKSLSYIKKELAESGIEDYETYYPYPDYRFMKNLYSDRHLPGIGELTLGNSNYDSDRLELFSEKDALEVAIAEGAFSKVANSYCVVTGTSIETEYARFSNDRADDHTIFTTIDRKSDRCVVRKHPLSKNAETHIRNIYGYYTKLNERYMGSDLSVNLCTLIDLKDTCVASFEYVKGRALSELMDECVFNDDIDGFYNLFDQYVSHIGFGEEKAISDLDVVFSNILVDGDKWTLIDYEWCREEAILTRELAYRAVYCYLLEDSRRNKINLDLIREKLVLSKAATDEIEADEVSFQKYVTGKNKSLSEIREAMGRKSINPIPMAKMLNQDNSAFVYQVYYADGTGQYSEANSYLDKDAYKSDTITESVVIINPDNLSIRIDPINAPAIVRVIECRINELDYPIENKKYLTCNGKRISSDAFVFDTYDPNLLFNLTGLVREENSFMYLKLEITRIEESVAKALCDKPKITDYLRK